MLCSYKVSLHNPHSVVPVLSWILVWEWHMFSWRTTSTYHICCSTFHHRFDVDTQTILSSTLETTHTTLLTIQMRQCQSVVSLQDTQSVNIFLPEKWQWVCSVAIPCQLLGYVYRKSRSWKNRERKDPSLMVNGGETIPAVNMNQNVGQFYRP